MKELLGYKMNGDETAVWKKLKNDVISELLSIHIPEMDEDYVASYVTDDFMGNYLPYVGVQGYKCKLPLLKTRICNIITCC